MEEQLARRIDLFKSSDVVDSDLVMFVHAELEGMAASGLTVTDDTVGTFATHLMMALQRCRTGETLDPSLNVDAVAAELQEFPAAVQAATQLAERARRDHRIELPEGETLFVALHLAAMSMGRDGR